MYEIPGFDEWLATTPEDRYADAPCGGYRQSDYTVKAQNARRVAQAEAAGLGWVVAKFGPKPLWRLKEIAALLENQEIPS